MKTPDVYIDADGCPVKEETYKVANRYNLKCYVVANKPLNIPRGFNLTLIEMVTVTGGFDAADDWIAEHIQEGDVAVTADILLADRCVKKQARVLDHKGGEFTADNIGDALATRELMTNLRYMGEVRGGPAPMDKKDKSKYLSKLDQVLGSRKGT